jgi:hypothetical protein
LICASNFQYPKDWPLDDKELSDGEIVEEKEKIRAEKMYQVSLRLRAGLPNVLRISSITK